MYHLLHINVLGDTTDPVNEASLHNGGHELDIALIACWGNPFEADTAQWATLGGLQMGQCVLEINNRKLLE